MNKITVPPSSSSSEQPSIPPPGHCRVCHVGTSGKRLVAVTKPCQHYFHFQCLAQQFSEEPTCPLGCKQVSGLRFLPPLPQDWQEKLCIAAAKGDFNVVTDILHQGGDANAGKSGRETPLSRAVHAMQFRVARELLRAGAREHDIVYRAAWDYARLGSINEFVSCLELLAENGHSEAAYQLGVIYLQGKYDIRKHQVKARTWFQKAATSSCHGASMINLAVMHRQALGNAARFDHGAAQWLKQAATMDYVPALFALGYYHLTGYLPGIECDAPLARVFLEKGLAKGNSWGLHYYCKMLNEGTGGPVNKAGALRWIAWFAKHGHASGQFMMGDACYSDSDFEKARQWYGRAASQGHLSAIVSHAIMCRKGLGGPLDMEQAIRLLAKVVEKSLTMTDPNQIQIYLLDDPLALYSQHMAVAHLVELYLQSGDAPDDFPVIASKQCAIKMLERAAKGDCTYAQMLLGKLYFYGHYSQPRNCLQALRWFSKAVSVGENYALFLQALVLLDRSWNGYSQAQGAEVLRKACESGVNDAQLMYEQLQQCERTKIKGAPYKRTLNIATDKIKVPTQPADSNRYKISDVLVTLAKRLNQAQPEWTLEFSRRNSNADPLPEAGQHEPGQHRAAMSPSPKRTKSHAAGQAVMTAEQPALPDQTSTDQVLLKSGCEESSSNSQD